MPAVEGGSQGKAARRLIERGKKMKVDEFTRRTAEAAETTILTAASEGLCATCRNKPVCAFLKPENVTVSFCEEFDVSEKLPEDYSGEMNISRRSVHTEVEEAGNASSARKGLCVNCDHYKTCAHRKSDERIWYCENYE
jgi:hypothetical protein